MPKVPTSPAQVVGPSAPQTRAAPTVFQQVRGVTADAFGAAEGRALEQVGQGLGAEADRRFKSEAQLQNRREVVSRAEIITEFSTGVDQFFTTAKAQTDLSQESPLAAFGLTISNMRTEARAKFQGSELGGLILDERLATIEGKAVGTAAKEAALIGLEKVKVVTQGYIDTARSNVVFEPDTLDEQIAATLKLVREDFGAFSPQEELEFNVDIRASLATTAITSHIIQGRIDKAESLMRRPDLANVIGEKRLLQLSKQIQEVRVADRKARAEARNRDITGADGQRIPREMFERFSEEIKRQFLGIGPGEESTILDEAATAEAGFPVGTVVEEGPEGKKKVLHKPGETDAEAQSKARAAETGKLNARRDVVESVLAAAGAPPLGPEGRSFFAKVEGKEAVPESEDFRTMMRHVEAARNLFAAGLSQEGRDQLALGMAIAKTSPDIARDKELDKVLSSEALQILGRLPVGSTGRDALGRIPLSIGEEAEQRAEGAAKGRGRVKAKLDIAFMDQATDLIVDFQNSIKLDSTIVGTLGGLRAKGQTITSVLKDFGLTAIVDSAKSIALTQTDASPEDFDGWFDNPKLSVLKVFDNSVGLILARTRTEGSRILASVIEKSIEDVNLTTGGSEQIVRRLDFVLNNLANNKRGIANVFGIDVDEVPAAPPVAKFQVKDGKFGPIEEPK